MANRLGDSDRRAVDLLLDRSTDAADGNGGGQGSYVAHAQPATEPGLQSVQRILNLLELLPAEEPAEDLLTRTLARIDAGAVVTQMHSAAVTMTNRPHA